jgi:predicted nucleotidyltransferase
VTGFSVILESVDLRHPLALVTPTLDAAVLEALAAGEVKLTGRAISQRTGASQEGVRRVLARLEHQGIVLREPAGKAHLHSLNRRHLAAPLIERLAMLRQELIQRLRDEVQHWRLPASVVVLFGSFARGAADSSSDIDILVVRSRGVRADDTAWRQQLLTLSANATAMTGNDTRLVEYSSDEAWRRRESDRLLAAARSEGLALTGTLADVRRRRRRRKARR